MIIQISEKDAQIMKMTEVQNNVLGPLESQIKEIETHNQSEKEGFERKIEEC